MMINVPYYGFYTHNADLQGSPTGAVLASILAYYGKEVSRDDLRYLKETFPNSQLTTTEKITSYLHGKGIDTNVLYIKSEGDLTRIIKKNKKSPIIIIQSPSNDYPGNIHILRIITGYDPKQKKARTHDYYRGPDVWLPVYELFSLAERKLVSSYKGLMIIPVGTPAENIEYPQLRQSQENIAKIYPLLEKQLQAFEAARNSKNTDAISALDDIFKSSDFDLLPRANRAYTYGLRGLALMKLERFSEAIESLKKSVELNSNLTIPDGVWQQYDQDAYPEASFYLGEAYRISGDTVNAKVYYQKTLEIDPGYLLAKDALSKIEKLKQ